MDIKDWCEENLLDYSLQKNIITVNNTKGLIIYPDVDNKIFDPEFDLLLSEDELDIIDNEKIDIIVYEFGGKWYYTDDPEGNKLNLLKYIGKPKIDLNVPFSYLGIHGRNDVANGTKEYSEWCRKAKFLGYDVLGICENNTLSGTFSFQKACKDNNIKSVLGETVRVKGKDDYIFVVKLYVTNEVGWNNLLHVNRHVNVVNQEDGYILEEDLFKLSNGLILVFDSSVDLNEVDHIHIKKYKDNFDTVYFQFDPVEYLSNERDKDHLLNLKKYLNNFLRLIDPVFIFDSYYLDKQDYHIKNTLNNITRIKYESQSDDQYMKTLDDVYLSLSGLFSDDSKLYELFEKCVGNTNNISDKCNFEIKQGKHLPKYEMSEEEKEKYDTNEELFWGLIQQGFDEKIKDKDEQLYLERIESEVEIIKEGELIDYFLITWDICRWADENNIYRNFGRGSAAGSLVSYLLNIVKIDPIEYGLYFERFLNRARLQSNMADIDLDIESEGRDKVKEYILDKYGRDQCCYIGTVQTWQIKGLLTDLGREYGVDFTKLKYITKKINNETETVEDLFKQATETPALKEFIQENPKLINDLNLGLKSIKSKGIHAAGVIITPKFDEQGNRMTIYDWIPVRKDGDILISEYDGNELDELGFLKEDILGISQLDKIKQIFEDIEESENIKLTLETIPLNDKKTLEYFQQGITQDIFQFSGSGMTGFLKDMVPDSIEDLIAANSIYRPATLNTGMHRTYINVKHGKKEPEYLFKMREVTEDTYSVMIYQEQMLKLVKEAAGFSIEDSEQVRRAIGKKKEDLLNSYEKQFIDGCIENGCDKFEAVKLWNLIKEGSGYIFNRSHSACYALLGYVCMYLKTHYPTYFYKTGLDYATQHYKKDQLIPSIISEINKLESTKILPPDINKSGVHFTADFDLNEIYWSINSIKYVGDVAVESIFEERKNNGHFFSLEEFLSRIDGSKVNKRVVKNLILCGAFDKIEKVKQIQDRYRVLVKYLKDILGEEEIDNEFYTNEIASDWFWQLKAKELGGLSYIDFKKIVSLSEIKGNHIDNTEFFLDEWVDENNIVVAGIINSFVERDSKNGKFAQITIDVNSDYIYFTCWNETWEKYKKEIRKNKDRIIVINGTIRFDGYKKQNVIHSTEHSKIEII